MEVINDKILPLLSMNNPAISLAGLNVGSLGNDDDPIEMWNMSSASLFKVHDDMLHFSFGWVTILGPLKA